MDLKMILKRSYMPSTAARLAKISYILQTMVRTPRDLILLKKVSKPIKVIICKLSTSSFVNPKLLDIAYKTGGSLHTLTTDIETLVSLKPGDILRVGVGIYRLDANGFVRIG